MLEPLDPEKATRHWLKKIVIGLNLCPFAAPVLRDNSLLISVCNEDAIESLCVAILKALDELQASDESEISTSLLVFSHGLKDFNDYLEAVDLAQDLLEQAGLEGIIQIATFHPDYCFEGEPPEEVSHYTNRSPYPMLHFIRETMMSRVLSNYPNPEKIPENNIQKLRALGRDHLLKLINPH